MAESKFTKWYVVGKVVGEKGGFEYETMNILANNRKEAFQVARDTMDPGEQIVSLEYKGTSLEYMCAYGIDGECDREWEDDDRPVLTQKGIEAVNSWWAMSEVTGPEFDNDPGFTPPAA